MEWWTTASLSGSWTFAGKGGEDAEGIFGGVGGEFFAVEVGHRGEEIGEAGEFVVVGAGGDFAGPAGDEGDAVSAIPDVGFVAAELGAGEVAFGFEGFDIRGGEQPLSLVKMTSVLSATPASSRAWRTLPVQSSTSMTKSP